MGIVKFGYHEGESGMYDEYAPALPPAAKIKIKPPLLHAGETVRISIVVAPVLPASHVGMTLRRMHAKIRAAATSRMRKLGLMAIGAEETEAGGHWAVICPPTKRPDAESLLAEIALAIRFANRVAQEMDCITRMRVVRRPVNAKPRAAPKKQVPPRTPVARTKS